MNIDIDKYIDTVKRCFPLSEKENNTMCDCVIEIMSEEPNMIQMSSPVIVVGDIHGQFYDLLKVFEHGGDISNNIYIFMGDYVDRGRFSVETIQLLLCYKIKYPKNIILQRGNHESTLINSSYGFYDECLRKYGSVLAWNKINMTFNYMPVCTVIDNKMFCVHGGLSPSIMYVDNIESIDRFHDLVEGTTHCDLMWADPEPSRDGFSVSSRGAGYLFGGDVTNTFLNSNNMNYILRSHQMAQEGYDFFFRNENCITVWSCPNYCYRCGNAASILFVNNGNEKIISPQSRATNELLKLEGIKQNNEPNVALNDSCNTFFIWKQTTEELNHDIQEQPKRYFL